MSKKKSPIRKLSEVSSSQDLMAQLLAKSGRKVGSFQLGQKVEGKVIAIQGRSVTVDIGAKAEGIISEREFDFASSYIKSLKPGDTISATVSSAENSSGQVHLSLKDEAQESGWQELEIAQKEGRNVDMYVIGANRGGLTVSVFGIEAFVPTSQLGQKYAKNPQGAIGKTLEAKIQDINKQEGRVILSERAVSDADLIKKQEEALKNIKKGEKVKGIVVGLVPFGAFVRIEVDGSEMEGLVHLSELSYDKVQDASQVVKEGDEVEVVIIGQEKGKLALSIKRGQEDPWEKSLDGIDVDTKLKGKVLRTGDFGAYIEIKPGIEAQVKLNKIPDGVSIREGDLVDVMVESIDKRRHQITVGFVLTAKPVGYK